MPLQNSNDHPPSPVVHQTDAPAPDSGGDLRVEDIQVWLVSHLAALLEREPEQIDVRTDFTDYGLNSIEVVNISGELETWLGCRLDPMLVLEYPNIEVLAAYLGQNVAPSVQSPQPPPPASNAQVLLDNLDQMSDEEVDGLLNSMLSEHDLNDE